jgi:hypothetical protein
MSDRSNDQLISLIIWSSAYTDSGPRQSNFLAIQAEAIMSAIVLAHAFVSPSYAIRVVRTFDLFIFHGLHGSIYGHRLRSLRHKINNHLGAIIFFLGNNHINKAQKSLLDFMVGNHIFSNACKNKGIDIESLHLYKIIEESRNESMDEFREKTNKIFSEVLGLDLGYLDLSEAELDDLQKYFYISELMIGCKESAVRVSPQVWQGIESRMLTVPKEDGV